MSNKKQNRLLIAIIAIALIVIVVLFSMINQNDQNQSPGVAADTDNGRDNATLRVTLQSAKISYDAGEALFVDVRSDAQYIASHVKGAVLIPLNEIQGNEPDVPKDALIFTYCTWPAEDLSARAAEYLGSVGYTNVYAVLGGYQAWLDAGYPIESDN